MDNYDAMLAAAQRRFTTYDMNALSRKNGVEDLGDCLQTWFFGQQVSVEKTTGNITVAGERATFGQTLAVLDWLCDRKEAAFAAEEFCPIGSLPGVYVGGSGLCMNMARLAAKIHERPEGFVAAYQRLGGNAEALGDMGCRLQIFPDLPMCLKFYFGDEEFSPSVTLLWDKNILHFVRYETVYYIAGCLQGTLLALI